MNSVFLQLGSNLGERSQLLIDATVLLLERVGRIIAKSKVYESTPWRVDGQENYLNQVIEFSTKYSAERVLKIVLEIETELGRVRQEKWGERLIDIDIIFFNDEIIENSDLCVPHKHMHERNFVLEPLNEIASTFIHPKYNKTVAELLKDSKDIERVEEYAI